MEGDGRRNRETDRHVCELFPVVMRRKESCLLLSLTLRLYCVLCLWQSMPSTPVTACTALGLCSIAPSARSEDEMRWHCLIWHDEEWLFYVLSSEGRRRSDMRLFSGDGERWNKWWKGTKWGWDGMRWKEIEGDEKMGSEEISPEERG